ncbi:hypothetical protein HDU98_002254 [Podochytrium sp. JEL0797]|nr:hypothetical protein HDU98_002254 [Podochytrium sp. JEL0797]
MAATDELYDALINLDVVTAAAVDRCRSRQTKAELRARNAYESGTFTAAVMGELDSAAETREEDAVVMAAVKVAAKKLDDAVEALADKAVITAAELELKIALETLEEEALVTAAEKELDDKLEAGLAEAVEDAETEPEEVDTERGGVGRTVQLQTPATHVLPDP